MNEISIILNVYKRPYSLERQIESIKNQTIEIKSENIHVWYNTPLGDTKHELPKDDKIKTYQCNYNTKFFGRFMIPLICQTKYVAIFDDDVIPGNKWFENCLETIKTHDGIIGGAGVKLIGNQYIPHTKVGWNGIKSDEIIEVDLVGHAWFYKQEYSKFMWLEEPPMWDNGEDMFLSYVAQKNGIKTFVPPHPNKDVELWCNVPSRDSNMGSDGNASYLINKTHMSDRDFVVKTLIKKGWEIIK